MNTIYKPKGAVADWSRTCEGCAHKRWRCRGRKRFIKLMMSEGVSRNYAERLADFVRGWMPYGEAWREYLWKKL